MSYQYQYQHNHYQFGHRASSAPLASTAKDFEWFTSHSSPKNSRYSWLDSMVEEDEEEEYLVPLKEDPPRPLMNFRLLDLTSWDDADADELLQLPHQNSGGTAQTDGAVIDAEEVHFYKSFQAPRGADAAWITCEPPPQSQARNKRSYYQDDYEYRQGEPYEEDEEYCEYFDLTALSSEDIATSTVMTATSASTISMMRGVDGMTQGSGAPLDAEYYDLTGVEDEQEHVAYPSPHTIVDLTRNNSPPHVDLTAFNNTNTAAVSAAPMDDDTGSVIYDLTYYESALESMRQSGDQTDQDHDADDEGEGDEGHDGAFPALHCKSTGTGLSSRSYDSCQSDQFSPRMSHAHTSRSASFHSATNNDTGGAAAGFLSLSPSHHSSASVSTATRNVRWLEPLVQQVRSIDATSNNTNKNSTTKSSRSTLPRRHDGITLEQEEETALLDMHVFSESRDEDEQVGQDRTSDGDMAEGINKDIDIPFTATNSTDEGSVSSSNVSQRSASKSPTPPADTAERPSPNQQRGAVPPYYVATAFLSSMLGWNPTTAMGHCPATAPSQPAASQDSVEPTQVMSVDVDYDDREDDDDDGVMIIERASPTASEIEEQQQEEEDKKEALYNAQLDMRRERIHDEDDDEDNDEVDDEVDDGGDSDNEAQEQQREGILDTYSNDGHVQLIDEASVSSKGDSISKFKKKRQERMEDLDDMVQPATGAEEFQKASATTSSSNGSKGTIKSEEGKQKKKKKKSKSKKSKRSSRKGKKKSQKPQEPSNLTVTWRRIKTKLTAIPWKKKRSVALFTPSSSSEDISDQEKKERRTQARMAIEKAAAETIGNKKNRKTQTKGDEQKSGGLCRKSILNRRRGCRHKPMSKEQSKDTTIDLGSTAPHRDGDADRNSEQEGAGSKSTLEKMPVSDALNEIMPLQAILSGDFDECDEEDVAIFHRHNGAAAVAIAALSRESNNNSPFASVGQDHGTDDSDDVFFNLSPNSTTVSAMSNKESIMVRRGSRSQSEDEEEDTNTQGELGKRPAETSQGVLHCSESTNASVNGQGKSNNPEDKITEPSTEMAASIVPLDSPAHLLADTGTSMEEACAGGRRDFWSHYSQNIKMPNCPESATCCEEWKSKFNMKGSVMPGKVEGDSFPSNASSSFHACWKPNLGSVDEATQKYNKESLPPWARDDIFCKLPESLYSSKDQDVNYTATGDTQDGDQAAYESSHFCMSSPNVNSISNLSYRSCGLALQRQQSDISNQIQELGERVPSDGLQKFSRFDSIDHCYSAGNNSVASSEDPIFAFVGCSYPTVSESPSSDCKPFAKSPLRDLCVDNTLHTIGSTWATMTHEVQHLKLDSADPSHDRNPEQKSFAVAMLRNIESVQSSGAMPNERDVVENIASVSSENSSGHSDSDSDSDSDGDDSHRTDNVDEQADGIRLATEDLLRALQAPRGASRGDSPINDGTRKSCSIDSNDAELREHTGNLSRSSSIYTPEEQSSMEDIALSYSGDNMDTWSFEPQVNDKNPGNDADHISQTAANLALVSQSSDDDDGGGGSGDDEPIIPSDKPTKKKPLSKFVKGILRGKSARKYSKKIEAVTSKQEVKKQVNPAKMVSASTPKNVMEKTNAVPAAISDNLMEKPASLKSIASRQSHDVSMSSLSVSSHGQKSRNKKGSSKSSTNGSSLDRKRLEQLVSDLMAHPHGFIFSSPVNLKEFPDYADIVKYPMDLGTILKKLLRSGYPTLLDFHADVSLTFENAMKYNARDSEVHKMAMELKEVFEGHFLELLDELEAKLLEKEEKARLEV